MQFASIRDFRLNASMVLGRAKNDESVVVTRRGKPVAILVPTTEDMLENVLRAVQGVRLKAAIEKARKEAELAGSNRLTPKEIDGEIRKCRKSLRD